MSPSLGSILLVGPIGLSIICHLPLTSGNYFNSSTGCPETDTAKGIAYNGHCYFAPPTNSECSEARHTCALYGGVLLYWTDSAELLFFLSEVTSFSNGSAIWTGLQRSGESEWSWYDQPQTLSDSELMDLVPGFAGIQNTTTNGTDQCVYLLYDNNQFTSAVGNSIDKTNIYTGCRMRQVGVTYADARFYFMLDYILSSGYPMYTMDAVSTSLGIALMIGMEPYYGERRGNSMHTVDAQDSQLDIYSRTCFNDLPFCTNGFTLAFWFKLLQQPDGASTEYYIDTGVKEGGSGLAIFHAAGAIVFEIHADPGIYNCSFQLLSDIAVNQWTHIVMSFGNSTASGGKAITVFVDKIQRFADTYFWETDIPHWSSSISVGTEGDAIYDEIALWDRVLNSEERKSVYEDDDFATSEVGVPTTPTTPTSIDIATISTTSTDGFDLQIAVLESVPSTSAATLTNGTAPITTSGLITNDVGSTDDDFATSEVGTSTTPTTTTTPISTDIVTISNTSEDGFDLQIAVLESVPSTSTASPAKTTAESAPAMTSGAGLTDKGLSSTQVETTEHVTSVSGRTTASTSSTNAATSTSAGQTATTTSVSSTNTATTTGSAPITTHELIANDVGSTTTGQAATTTSVPSTNTATTTGSAPIATHELIANDVGSTATGQTATTTSVPSTNTATTTGSAPVAPYELSPATTTAESASAITSGAGLTAEELSSTQVETTGHVTSVSGRTTASTSSTNAATSTSTGQTATTTSVSSTNTATTTGSAPITTHELIANDVGSTAIRQAATTTSVPSTNTATTTGSAPITTHELITNDVGSTTTGQAATTTSVPSTNTATTTGSASIATYELSPATITAESASAMTSGAGLTAKGLSSTQVETTEHVTSVSGRTTASTSSTNAATSTSAGQTATTTSVSSTNTATTTGSAPITTHELIANDVGSTATGQAATTTSVPSTNTATTTGSASIATYELSPATVTAESASAMTSEAGLTAKGLSSTQVETTEHVTSVSGRTTTASTSSTNAATSTSTGQTATTTSVSSTNTATTTGSAPITTHELIANDVGSIATGQAATTTSVPSTNTATTTGSASIATYELSPATITAESASAITSGAGLTAKGLSSTQVETTEHVTSVSGRTTASTSSTNAATSTSTGQTATTTSVSSTNTATTTGSAPITTHELIANDVGSTATGQAATTTSVPSTNTATTTGSASIATYELSPATITAESASAITSGAGLTAKGLSSTQVETTEHVTSVSGRTTASTSSTNAATSIATGQTATTTSVSSTNTAATTGSAPMTTYELIANDVGSTATGQTATTAVMANEVTTPDGHTTLVTSTPPVTTRLTDTSTPPITTRLTDTSTPPITTRLTDTSTPPITTRLTDPSSELTTSNAETTPMSSTTVQVASAESSTTPSASSNTATTATESSDLTTPQRTPTTPVDSTTVNLPATRADSTTLTSMGDPAVPTTAPITDITSYDSTDMVITNQMITDELTTFIEEDTPSSSTVPTFLPSTPHSSSRESLTDDVTLTTQPEHLDADTASTHFETLTSGSSGSDPLVTTSGLQTPATPGLEIMASTVTGSDANLPSTSVAEHPPTGSLITPQSASEHPTGISTATQLMLTSKSGNEPRSQVIAQLQTLVNATLVGSHTDSETATQLFNSTAELAGYSTADPKDTSVLVATAEVYIELASLLVQSFGNYTIEEATDVIEASLSVVDSLVSPNNAQKWTKVGSGLVAEITQTAEHMAVSLAERAGNGTTDSIVLTNEHLVTTIDFLDPSATAGAPYTFPKNASAADQATYEIPASVLESHGAWAVVTLLYHSLGPLLQEKAEPGEEGGGREMDERHRENGGESQQLSSTPSVVVGSKVLSVTLVPPLLMPVDDAVQFGFHLHSKSVATVVNQTTMKMCSFWNFSIPNTSYGAWSNDGCHMTSDNETHARCSCDHMTSFAVLIQVVDIEISEADSRALHVISLVGCGFSITGTFLMCSTYLFLRMTSVHTLIHSNLAAAIMLAQITFLFEDSTEKETVACAVVTGLLYYFNMAAFCWMLIEGVHIYFQVVVVFVHTDRLKMYILIGWGLPLIFTIITTAILRESLGMHEVCWLSLADYSIWFFVVPVIIVILVNYYILVRVTKVIVTLTKAHGADKFDNTKKSVKASIMLLPLLGSTWVFGFLCVTGSTIVFHYLFAICNSFQGFCLFLAYCALSTEVRDSWQKKRDTWSLARSIHAQRSSKVSPSSRQDAWAGKGISTTKSFISPP